MSIDIHHVVALEQFKPMHTVSVAAAADAAGFAGSVVADRFQPWLPSQGEAPFVWTLAGAIAQATSGKVTVSAIPGYRMHVAAVAQASATLAAMVPGRHTLTLAAGDAIDEHVVAGYWPEAADRISNLFDAADAIRKLFAASLKGKDIRHSGPGIRLESARLWTMPDEAPPVAVWAAGPATARRAGRTVDGIVVQAGRPERMAALLAAYREGCAESGRTGSATAHVQLSWADTDEQATQNALREWPMAGLRFPRGDIRSPFDVAQLVRSVTAEDLRERMCISSDPDIHRAHVQSFLDLGFDTIHVHNIGRNQQEWIDVVGREILPRLVR
ncbi:TIGR03557 family F420-dependent LLM class oxidoreductase [Microbacterium pseudoresistens]|uniref:G6PDH family F420-dependent oxidoreductase n=1 Tax=Microbacterium pseudoresistens TaxID=640634 RepID=A0A7Y9EV35_9MICO|nr:G6PDH family F420-dependent oxidoreductase [Microbacterium pseudoresistens]